MNPLQKALRRVDGWQQKHPRVAVVYAVQKKFGDDNAGSLAALIAYYGFLSLFPLLLVAVTVLGYVLAGDPHLRDQILGSALGNFPIIGNQLKSNVSHPLTGNIAGVVVGVAGLVWGSLGVTQQAQYAMAQVWHIPQVERPNFVGRLLRGLAFLGLLGGSAVVTTALAGAGSFGASIPGFARIAGPIFSLLVDVGLYLAAFRVLTPAQVATRDLVPGAIIGGIGWFVLQMAGGYVVGHNLKNSSQVYGMFGLVLGLISWIYLGAQLSLYAAEINVVRARRLWPRSLVQPPLTDADRQVMAGIADQQQRRDEEVIDVRFTGDAAPGQGADEAPGEGRGEAPDDGRPRSESGAGRN